MNYACAQSWHLQFEMEIQTKRVSSLLELDYDCFFRILSYIPNIREKLRLRRVSKRFHYIVDQYFQECELRLTEREHIYYKREKSDHNQLTIQLKPLLVACAKLRELRNDIVQIDWNLDEIRKIKCIRVLEFDWRKESFRVSNIEILLFKCVNLQALGLIGYDGASLNHRCISEQLDSLCLDYCTIPFEELKNLLIYKGPQLKRFEYHSNESNHKISQNLVDLIGNYCRKLRNLRLYANITESIDGLKKLINLEYIFLIFDLPGHMVKEIIKNNHKLKCLIVHQNEIDYEEILNNCVIYCPFIEEISINNRHIPRLTEKELFLWKELPRLTLIHSRPYEYYEREYQKLKNGEESELDNEQAE